MNEQTPTAEEDAGLSREEMIEQIERAIWKVSDEKLDVIAAVIDL